MSTPRPKRTAATPRPSASLLVLSPTNRLLFLQRPSHHSFASAHVFPGGAISASDTSPQHCALRETFEETGLLLTTAPPPASVGETAEVQKRVHAGSMEFGEWVRSWDGNLVEQQDMLPMTTWITPPGAPKRYSSSMFLTRLPAWISEYAAVTGDGGVETVGKPVWMSPSEALEKAGAGEVVFYPPQFYLLHSLAGVLAEGKGWEELEMWAREKGGAVCEPVREGVLKSGEWVIGLGPRGDRELLVTLVPGGKGVEPRAVGVVGKGEMKETLERERAEKEREASY